MKRRVQHPEIHEREDRGSSYWFFRYWEDTLQPDGTVKSSRKFHRCGPSSGKEKISKKRAELIRDKFLVELNAPPEPPPQEPTPQPPATSTTEPAAAGATERPITDPGQFIFGRLAELWKTQYVEKVAAGKHVLARPTRENYLFQLKNHILPRWQNARLAELRPTVVLEWLQDVATSWHMMIQLRNIMSGIITRAVEWELIPYTYANPMRLVKLPKKWEKREKRILTEEETARVFAQMDGANLLICETCLDTSARISEVTGLKIHHVDIEKGTIRIAQRAWHGDIDVPKTEKSKRTLALGALTVRYKAWIASLKRKGPDDWVFPQEDDLRQPRWDSGVRNALKKAARSLKQDPNDEKDMGLDFPGFGPHSLRRANITMRQEVGGSAIEAGKIAGHTNVGMTSEYTIIQMKRQQDLTRRIQERRAKAAKKAKVVEMKKKGTAA